MFLKIPFKHPIYHIPTTKAFFLLTILWITHLFNISEGGGPYSWARILNVSINKGRLCQHKSKASMLKSRLVDFSHPGKPPWQFFFTKQGFLICLESICCDTGWHCRIAAAYIKSVLGAGYQKRCIVIMVKILWEIDSGFSNEILKKPPPNISAETL